MKNKYYICCACALAFILWYLIGCSSSPKVIQSPSTQPLQSDLGRAQTHIGQARTLAQRIRDKDVIIDMWRKQHDKN